MVQSQLNEMLQNPQILDMIIQSNPQLRAMGPEVRQYMQSPMFRQMMTDPNTIQQMSAQAAMMRGGGGAPAFPNGLGSTGTAGQQQDDQQPGQAAPPTNPFGMFGAPPGGAEGDPLAFMRSMMGSPPANTEGDAPDTGASATGAPGADPAAFMRNLMAARGAGGSPFDAFGGGGLGAGLGTPPPPADTRPPEERFADQLRQLNDMGFYDFDRNIEALRRSGGSVQGAVNQLLGG